jgi:hypothetical protein
MELMLVLYQAASLVEMTIIPHLMALEVVVQYWPLQILVACFVGSSNWEVGAEVDLKLEGQYVVV